MATAKELLTIIARCASRATESEPVDINMRARVFVAMLSGSLSYHSHHAAEHALDKLLGADPKPAPVDGA